MSERPGRNVGPAIGATLVAYVAAGFALALPMASRAQLAPRLSAQVALDALGAADASLLREARLEPGSSLDRVHRQLAAMGAALKSDMGSDSLKPIELVGDGLRGRIARAHAAAARVQAYLTAAKGCLGGDAAAMQAALAEGVDRLAQAGDAAKQVPVIDSVQDMAQQPLFALHQGSGPLAFALTGSDLADTQCPGPTVVASDAAGKLLASQPMVTGAVPGRIELRWPDAGALPVGGVVLHAVAQHKVFLLGCKALPPASAVMQVVPPVRFEVAYTLDAVCPGAKADGGLVALAHGRLPPLKGYGATVSQPVDTSACPEPASYRLGAAVIQGDGQQVRAGPFTQGAQASITAGLPGGLSLNWNPALQTLFVRAGAATCKGVR